MDNGYIFSGWDGYYEYEPDGNTVDYKEGWLVRFDSEGNELWNYNNLVSVDDFFYSVVQLPEGGYITGGTWGGSGYLVRYAPETGIGGAEPPPALGLGLAPSPFSSSLSISFEVPETEVVELCVFDISGRLVERLAGGSVASGEHISVWNPDESVPAGCYVVTLSDSQTSTSVMCIYLK